MDIFNLVIFILLAIFFLVGLFSGMWHIISGIVSLVVGIIAASHWYEVVALKLLSIVSGNLNLARILAFLLIFIAVRLVIALIFMLIKKFFGLFKFIPFHGLLSHMIGGLLSLAIGGLIIGFLLDFSTKFSLGPDWIAQVVSSEIALFLINFSHILGPLIPQALQEIESIIP